jgi:predicted dienelactone hydrolase
MWLPRIGVVASLAVVAALGTVLVPATSFAGSGSDEVTVLRETFVDESRPSPASNLAPEAPTRTLETRIALPPGKGRHPLVLLAHGANGNPDKFSQLIDTWARAGYVVAAPRFPRSSDAGGNFIPDYVEQPADLSFVLDRVLELNRTKGSKLRGRIDPKHIGLAGLSLGGFTTYGTVWNSCCRDDRIDAAILMSAVFGPFPEGEYDFRSVPVLLLHGDADGLYPHSVEAYPQLAGPKWFVTLQGGTHAFPFEDVPEASDEVVREVTTAFWDRWLKGERRAERAISEAVEASGLATLQQER